MADVVRLYGEEYLRTHPSTAEQRRVLRAIGRCRTAALGGHVEECGGCAARRIAYNSCRNRHCPKCQGKETARWMAAEASMLLPVPYFHLVFTLPHLLNPLARTNRRLLYGLLFRVAWATLRTFALDPRHLGAEPAVTMVLHTWGQTLSEHIHVHCVVSGGGLSLDGRSWVRLPAGRRRRRRSPFLFPVEALSRVFRGKYLEALGRLRRQGHLHYVGQSAVLLDANAWQKLHNQLWQQDWVVYAKRPFGTPERVLKYLSRYTHRVAIANRRIRGVGDGQVRFAYRDYADRNRHKEITLSSSEFLRRFLLHVVPRGFTRIRHCGVTANCRRAEKLARCRELLGAQHQRSGASAPAAVTVTGWGDRAEPQPARCCPVCGGTMRVVERLAPAPCTTRDTS
jgi:hypothetical protein